MALGDKLVNLDGLKTAYDAVEEQVDNLNSAFGSTNDIFSKTSGNLFFIVGNINTANGVVDETPTGTRLISEFVYIESGAVITTNASTFEFVLTQYNANKEYVGYNGFATTHAITVSGYYRIMVRLKNNPSGDITSYIRTAINEIAIFDYTFLSNLCSVYPTLINESNYVSVLPDANSAKANTTYIIMAGEGNNRPANLPQGIPTYGIAIIVTVGQRAVESGSVQLCFSELKDIYMRKYSSGQWQSWFRISSVLSNDYSPLVTYSATAVAPANYQTILPDANNADVNVIYRITGFTSGSSTIPNGLPKTDWDTNWTNAMLLTLGNSSDIYAKVQLFIAKNNIYYRNYQSGEWQTWVSISGKPNTIKVSALGAGDYTSFSEAIIAAFAVPNTIVYVDRGTYNVWDEMKAIMGSDYWDNLTEQTQYSYGLPWGNGMKIIGSPGAEIVFDGSQTTNDNTWYFFSPLMGRYVYGSDKTVSCEGLTFRVKNFRYAIHIDEGPINNDYTYIVKDCQFYCDNTDNPRTKASDAIGMGASINTTYIIEDNYISASYAPTARDYENIYFHNTNAESPKNKCRISNNYMDNVGTIRIDGYGDSLNKCKVQINGNSCGSALLLPNPTTDNLECLVWNNEIRNS